MLIVLPLAPVTVAKSAVVPSPTRMRLFEPESRSFERVPVGVTCSVVPVTPTRYCADKVATACLKHPATEIVSGVPADPLCVSFGFAFMPDTQVIQVETFAGAAYRALRSE